MSAGLTQPDYAALLDPPFDFAGRRVTASILIFRTLKLFTASIEMLHLPLKKSCDYNM
jgi:hypothetical protein